MAAVALRRIGRFVVPFSFHRVLTREDMTGLTDIELLDAYARDRSEEAFRELVTRHVDFIYSAAMRQLRNPHQAEEATQSAFIALAGKAGHLQRQTVVAGWLHRAAHFAALKLQRNEARRKHWEEQAATVNAPGDAEQAFQEHALPHVDGALTELNETDRDAVILRFLQQKSLRDVAQALGTSEEPAKKRVSRALEKLRGLLVRRGVVIPAAALAAGLSHLPVTAAPASLASALGALAVNPAVPTLTTSATLLALMASSKAKLAVAGGLVLLGGLAALLWPRRAADGLVTPTNTAPSLAQSTAMKIRLTSIPVDDQDKALRFYTEIVGFVKKRDFPVGAGRRLTVVSPAEPDGTELVLEPMGFAPTRTFQAAVFRAGVPFTTFMAEDIQREYDRMTRLGAKFTSRPTKAGDITIAVFEDTCGNRILLFQPAGLSNPAAPAIKLKVTSVMVADQDKALNFYTDKLGFVKKQDEPVEGGGRWLTVVSPDEPNGTELLLEPMGLAAARPYQRALFDAGMPWTAFQFADVEKQHERLTKLGVAFRTPPTRSGPATIAVLDDTCGNWIQLFQP
jgi:RNA polymerase sigma factor (sigma-70 family)